MNKTLKTILAVLGGIEAAFSIAIPILLSLLWINFSGLSGISSEFVLGAGMLASLFRAIKVGWLTRE